jgi:DNA-binding CsgD family transcriptional regulator
MEHEKAVCRSVAVFLQEATLVLPKEKLRGRLTANPTPKWGSYPYSASLIGKKYSCDINFLKEQIARTPVALTFPALFRRRDEFFGQLCSCAKEVLLHLLDQKLLRFGLPRLEPVFIEQHLGVLGPHLPGLSAHGFIDFLPQFGIERGFIQAGKFASKLCAFDHTRHGNIVTRAGGGIISSPMSLPTKSISGPRRGWLRDIVIYGVCGGVLITLLRLMEYRFLVVEHSVEIYGALIAALFAGIGIWLGVTLTRKKPNADLKKAQELAGTEVPAASPFVVDEARMKASGLTPREIEILGLIASGLSNREIAARLFVSENTVKTHSSRLFDKLGAKRRTQAVQFGKAAGLIP